MEVQVGLEVGSSPYLEFPYLPFHDCNGFLTKLYFRCECDPGYGPSVMVDPPIDGSQYLCASKIDQEESGKCETLQTLNAQNEKVRVSPEMLDDGLKISQERPLKF